MTLDEMLVDFCKRAKTDYTPENVKICMENNHHILTEDGFMVFNIVQDEAHVLFCYVVPGKKDTFKNFVYFIEAFAKMNGCRKVKFATKRDKAFSRVLKDYKPYAILYEKELK